MVLEVNGELLEVSGLSPGMAGEQEHGLVYLGEKVEHADQHVTVGASKCLGVPSPQGWKGTVQGYDHITQVLPGENLKFGELGNSLDQETIEVGLGPVQEG